MAADLYIHIVYPPSLEQDVLIYLRRDLWSSEIGNAEEFYLVEDIVNGGLRKIKTDEELKQVTNGYTDWSQVYAHLIESLDYDENAVCSTSSIWIGSVSWLKAALFEKPNQYIPSTVEQVNDLFIPGASGLVIIDDALIEKVREAFTLSNTTQCSLASCDHVLGFLECHKGYKAFCISW